MTSRTYLPRPACLAGALLLAACTTAPPPAPTPAPKPTLTQVLSDADAAARAGQYDQAYALLEKGGSAYPADKAPWLQMAQMKFDRGQYGDAIGHALEALERDPDDKVANSIVAVSGLRLSGKALADLSRQNNLNGSLRSEAQELAKLLRASIGEEVLVPPARRPAAGGRRAAASSAPAPAAAPAVKGGADPFSGLK
ncbi:tetratricopeptide repeat protein [Janthinobacterium psychrotolerans]|uniref:Tetratricopeptide repeat-containing protein n=1 Tax=Janthinobacterium psychrotolerans TaxID=1747903 RepID=A0A1A7BVP1_9BURK|nr:tetratricopeptide repeat protein [Janthinobacterium psychrotolerans]OBV36829.1 Tetratricopeptide repeat-containing protein [Janthinobacterium psychrotolerans]